MVKSISANTYQLLFQESPIVQLIIDSDGKIVNSNKKASEYYGYTYKELLQMNISKINLSEEKIDLKNGQNLYFKHKLANGEIRDVEVFDKFINVDGNRLIHSTIFDITDKLKLEIEQKECESSIVKQKEDTKFKKIEEEFIESKKKYKMFSQIVKQSFTSIIITNLKGKIEYVNQAFTNTTGYSYQEVIGQNPRILKSNKTNPEIYYDLWKTITKGDVWKGEFINKHKNGKEYFERATIAPIMDKNNKIVNFFAIIEDITLQKRVDLLLQESEKRSKNIITKMINAFTLHEIIFNEKGKPIDYIFLEVNPAWENFIGIKSEDIIGKTLLEVFPEIEDVWINLFKRVALTGIPEEIEEYSRRKQKYFHCYAYSPEPRKLAVLFNDITQRKKDEILLIENEKRLKYKIEERTKELLNITLKQKQLLSLFDKGEVALIKWKYNKNWSIEYISDGAQKIFGYHKEDFFKKRILYTSIIDKRDVELTSKELMDAISLKLDFFTHQPYRIITKDNKIKWVMDNVLIAKDENNKVTGFLGYISDITLFKELEIKISQQKDLLQQQSKLAMMGEMIGAIAHQWRQPLSELSISIQMLKYVTTDKLLEEDFIENFVKKNKDTINFMSKTIDNFRNFFKIDKEKEKFSIKEAIHSTIHIISSQLKNNSIDLTLTGEDFIIDSFRGEFQQVILNLVNNSKDALIENNIENRKIDIILKKKLSKNYIKKIQNYNKIDNEKFIIIKDNAGGIPTNIIDRIFEPYFTTKEQGKGTGIGLYMSKTIIETNMQGFLTAFNSSKGAEFIIGLK